MNRTPPTSVASKSAALLLPALFVLVPLVFDSDLYRFAFLPKLAVLQAGLVALLFAVALDAAAGRNAWALSPVFLPAVLFLLLCAFAVPGAENPVAAVAFLSYQTSLFLTFLVVARTADPEIAARTARWACAAAILFSTIGILEYWGIDTGTVPSNGRPSSTFGYRNFAATYVIALLPLSAIVSLRSPKSADTVLGAASGLLMALFLVYTRSRGAWIGAGAALVIFLAGFLKHGSAWTPSESAARSRKRRIGIAAAVVFLVLAPLGPSIRAPQSRDIDENKAKLLDAMSSLTASGGDRGRWRLWESTLEMIADHPLGVGLDNWKVHYPAYDDGTMIRVGSAPERPHNDLLWIASESGLVSAAVYVWILVAGTWMAIRLLRTGDRAAAIPFAFFCGIVAVSVHGLVSFPRERVEASFFVWAGLGIIAAHGPRRTITIDRRMSFVLPVLAAACLAVTTLAIRFDAALLGGLRSLAANDTVGLARHAAAGIDAGPFDSRIYLLQNKVHQSHRNFAAAAAACRTGLAYHPNSPELYGDLGMAHARAGNSALALDALNRALELSPAQYQTLNNLGGVYQQSGDFDRAREAYERALRLEPRYVGALSNLGLVQTLQGDYDAAVATFEQAVDLAGSEPGLTHNLADALYLRARDGDHARAARLYRAFLQQWRGDPEETRVARSRLREIETP